MIDPVYVLLHVFCIEKVVIENISSYLQLQKANKTAFLQVQVTDCASGCSHLWSHGMSRIPPLLLDLQQTNAPTCWKAHRGVKNSTPTYWLQNNKNLYQKGYYTTLSIRNPARIKRLSKGGWSERFHGYWSIRSWLHDGDFLEKQIIWKNLR